MTQQITKRSRYILQIKFLLFAASLVPALVTGVLVYPGNIFTIDWLLIITGLFLAQAGGDYLYYYFTNNHTDTDDSHTKIFAGWRPFFAERFKRKKTPFVVGLLILHANVFIIGYFSAVIGWKITVFALIGGFIAFFFTFLMRMGLKEVIVFLTFGPLSMAGAYLALTKELALLPVLVSIPLGLLITVVAYLKGAKIKVSSDGENIVSLKLWLIKGMLIGAFASLAILIAAQLLPIHSILAFAGVIPATVLYKKIKNNTTAVPVYLSATIQSILTMIIVGLGIMAGWILQFHFPFFM
ncbi:MAG: hypothetical protein R6U85_13455 [Salinivirgaceae bacterium]